MYCLSWRDAHVNGSDEANRHGDSEFIGLGITSHADNQSVRSGRRTPTRTTSAARPLGAARRVRSTNVTPTGSVVSNEHSLGTISTLEGAAMALGARALTPEQVDAARLTNTLIRRNLGADMLSAAEHLAVSFHRQLLGACPNRHMVTLLSSQPTPAPRLWSPSPDEFMRMADEHDQLLDMVAAGEPMAGIERFARRHADTSHGCLSWVTIGA